MPGTFFAERLPKRFLTPFPSRAALLAGTILLFVARPLLPSESIDRTGEGVALVLLGLLTAAVWAGAAALGHGRFFRVRCLDAAVLTLIAWHSATALIGCREGNVRAALNVLWAWIGMGLGYFLLRALVRPGREARAVVAVLLALGAALSVQGLYQFAVELPEQRAAFAKDPEGMMRASGEYFPPGSPGRTLFENRVMSTEPLGTFALTNSLAGYLAPWLAVLLAVLSQVKRMSAWRWSALLTAAVAMAACLVLTKSRSGYAALALGVAWILLAAWARRTRFGWRVPVVGAAVLAAIVAGAVAVGGLDREVLGEASKSLGYRLQYWQATVKMIGDRPWLGCGPGQFQDAYTLHKLPEASEEIADPHNFLLEVWATTGTPGAVALSAVLVCLGASLLRRLDSELTAKTAHGTQSCKSPDAVSWIFGGATLGVVASWPLGLVGIMPPDWAFFAFGLPAAAITVWALGDWIERGELPPWILGLGVVVLLVHLSAAGGIGFPGVACTFWALAAIGMAQSDARMETALTPGPAPQGRGEKAVGWGLAGVLVGLAAACYATAYRPVMTALACSRAALSEPSRTEEHLLAAARADRWDPTPWSLLSAWTFARWQEDPSPDRFAPVERYAAEAIRRAPRNHTFWMALGDRCFEAFESSTGSERRPGRDPANDQPHAEAPAGSRPGLRDSASQRDMWLAESIRAYRRVVELYPNDAVVRAKLALALHAAGDAPGFATQLAAALELDRLCPHADKKIPPALRQRLLALP